MSTTNEASSVPNAVATADTTEDSTSDPTITSATTAAAKKSKTPSDFLKSILGRPIRVKLNSGIEYRGVLGSLDGYLNIAIEQTEEYSTTGQLQAKYGDCFIRGNNGTSLSKRRTHSQFATQTLISPSRSKLTRLFAFSLVHFRFIHRPIIVHIYIYIYIYIIYTLIVMYISTPPQR